MKYEKKTISHSMADGFLQCKKKFEFAHVMNLQPKTRSDGLERGNTGHKFFEAFFRAIKEGKSTEEAQTEGVDFALKYEGFNSDSLPLVLEWVARIWPELDWKILEVERTYRLKIGELTFPFTIDLLIESKGFLYIVDHKFLYDFYDQEVIDILPQLPKYIGALRAMGVDVTAAKYNMVRTRAVKDPALRFRMVPVEPSNSRVKQAMKEQILVMKEMTEGFTPNRTPNSMNCGNCAFKTICAMQLNEERIDLVIDHKFERNTYGYDDE